MNRAPCAVASSSNRRVPVEPTSRISRGIVAKSIGDAGLDITFQGPSEDDIFFGIVQRGAAMIMLKEVGVDPVPNYTRDIKKGIARWDAYLHVPDPDALAAEFSSRNVEFFQPLNDNDDGLRGFEIKDADGYLLYFGRPVKK